MTANTLEQRARELLAAEYERDNYAAFACYLRTGTILGKDSLRAIRAIEAALRLSAGADWQPIETAPKDGTSMLVHSTKGWIGRVKWSLQEGDCFEDEHTEFVKTEWLTHWQPLPAAPRHEPDDALRGDKT